MATFRRVHRMISADKMTKLKVYAKEGKRGFNVGVTYQEAGSKARTGCQDTFDNKADASARADVLIAEATELGYLPRGEAGAAGRRSAFNSIPAPGAGPNDRVPEAPQPVPAEEPVAEMEAEPVTAGADEAPRRRNRK